MLKRVGATLLAVSLLVGGCGGGEGKDGSEPTRSSSPTTQPFALSQAGAGRALQALAPPAGWSRKAACPGRKDCPALEKSMRWSRLVQFEGPELPGGNGITGLVVARVSEHKSAGLAHAALTKVEKEEQHYDGRFSTPIKGSAGSYRPGESGSGTVDGTHADGWTGLERDATFSFTFSGQPPSAKARMQRIFLVQGPYELSVYVGRTASAKAPDAAEVLSLLLDALAT
ncbi:MAG TPA: hypothetical protein VNS81_02315 [Nocardioides sp.]|nr:hypothetical protein [Nocardioides sp.]